MKQSLLFIYMVFPIVFFGQKNDSLLKVLDKELLHQEIYILKKEKEIRAILQEVKQQEQIKNTDALFNSYLRLFEEYRSFKYDSAYFYVERAKNLALVNNRSREVSTSKVKEGFVLISAGLFMEALDTLGTVKVNVLDAPARYDYYFTMARAYLDLANYNDDPRFQIDYIKKGIGYLNLAKANTSWKSARYWAAESLIRLKKNDWEGAKQAYLCWIKGFDLSPHDYGVATSSLSYVYSMLGKTSASIEYITKAAISDVRSATKENIALRHLANKIYEHGNLERANNYVHQAMADATFYNARHRKIEISSILPIIESTQLQKVEQQNTTLQGTVVLLALLAVIVLVFIGIIFKQLKEKNKARQALKEYNLRLEELNASLVEVDAIKQDYITYFLRVTSELINKIGKIQKSTIHRIKTKRPEDVLNVLTRYSIKNERNELFHQFDLVFLELFPSFIEEFNKLFPLEEQRVPKKNELLNTELRIFAMYRLGIQDSQQVADFLNVSISTVYTYKTRIKTKSNHRQSFEAKIMEIKRF